MFPAEWRDFEEFDMANRLISGATGKQRQQGLEDATHRDKMPEIQGRKCEGNNLFVP
ncbi:MAG: hypothetical protein K8R46_04060 [Pirellulales bacterium]|nr:hypothetical protein [Pirellulales bacterium]